MQNITLHSHVGSDGILQLKVPPDFTNTDLTVILTAQPVMPSVEISSPKNREPSILVEKGGVLMANVEPLCDLTDIVRQERERRIEELIQPVGLWKNISPQEAQQLIQRNVLDVFEVITLSEYNYISVINHLSESGLVSGVIYDALILKAAMKANVDNVVTLNEKDFKRVYPDFAHQIISPWTLKFKQGFFLVPTRQRGCD